MDILDEYITLLYLIRVFQNVPGLVELQRKQ